MQGVVGTELSSALINCAVTPCPQALTAAHKYCLCLKDCREGPVIENPDIFIDVNISPYHSLERASVGQRVGAGGMTGPRQKASAGRFFPTAINCSRLKLPGKIALSLVEANDNDKGSICSPRKSPAKVIYRERLSAR